MKKPDILRTAFHEYAVEKQVGQGANSVVYSVRSDQDEILAAKALCAEKCTRKRMLRFENEYRFCISMRHPNIVSVVDSGLHDGTVPFFLMPLYEDSLESLKCRIEPESVLDVFSKILEGLEAAHLQGVTHRDLKPANILVDGDGVEVVVADFGIAAFHDEDLYVAVETDSRERLGSFQYAAPEQRIRGAEVGVGADIYSLGLILNELFTGELALAQNYKTIGCCYEEFSFLDPVVNRMLQQNPAERYASVLELKHDISLHTSRALSQQKLDQLALQVVPEDEVTDPLVLQPVEIVGKDWNDNVLTIELSQPLTKKWQDVMGGKTGGLSYRPNLHPGQYRVRDGKLVVSVSAQMAKTAYEQLRGWLPTIRKSYKDHVERELKERKRMREQKLQAERDKERERIRVLKELEGE